MDILVLSLSGVYLGSLSTSTLPSFLLFLAITSCFLPTTCIRSVILHHLILDLLFLLLYMDHVESLGSPYAYLVSKRHNLIMASSIILALPGHQDGGLYYSLDSAEVNLPSSSLGAGVCRHASCRFAMRLEHSGFVTVIRNHGFSLFSCVLGGRKSFTTGLSIIDVVFVLYMHGKIAHSPPGTRKDGSSSVDR